MQRLADTPFDLGRRVVIVTGGAGLLGREFCRHLVRSGANVVIADLSYGVAQQHADALCDEVGNRQAIGLEIDVSCESAVVGLVEATLDTFGRIDGLVNNAAINPAFDLGATASLGSAFESYALENWNRAIAVNLTGAFLCSREAGRVMRDQGRGTIINIASTYGLVGPDQRIYQPENSSAAPVFKPVDYSVSKAGLIGLTKYLAAYWAGTGVRVNALTPGGVHNEQPDAFVERYAARTPLGRMAERHEYCGALQFLLSDASSYMTGANLVVDGGWTAW